MNVLMHRRFPGFALVGLGLFSLISMVGEQDSRGLLLYNAPEVLAVSEIGAESESEISFPAVWGVEAGQAGNTARRLLPRRATGSNGTPGSDTETSDPVSGQGPETLNQPGNLAPTPPSLAQGPVGNGSPAQLRTPGLSPVGSGGTAGGPVIAVVTTEPAPPPPVVPAVPEPASWLLMILGVAGLGWRLRARHGSAPIRIKPAIAS